MRKNVIINVKKIDDASHVYRGYRRQLLFILHEILTGDKNSIFCPEGIEDFSVIQNDKVVSIFQVKDYTASLSISNLSSEKDNSFFKRAIRYNQEYPDAKITLIYYGKLGLELQKVSEGDNSTIDSCSRKISIKERLLVEEIKRILEKIEFRQITESEIYQNLSDCIEKTQLGLDVENSIDLLMWWLFKESENKTRITKDNIIDKIKNIGCFVRERTLHHEWLGSISPLSSFVSKNADIQKLKETYLQGISATMDHISMNLDIVRSDKIELIRKNFIEHNIVIIRGASGQGKTSLAYRYFHDNIPIELSYKINEPADRSHAFSISEAIIEHHKTFDMPIYLYYDVNISDTQWPYILERFSGIPNVFILLTIRNEDWKRSNAQIKEKVSFEEIELDFTKDEAMQIFSRITSANYVEFENTWIDFGEQGPLLEYIYLLQNGERLKDRLSTQINRIKDESNKSRDNTELNLLRIITMANSYGAKLEIKQIKMLNNLPSPESILNKFDREFLIRYSNTSGVVEGFHAVRSQILCSLLFDDTFQNWVDTFPETFEAISEEDIEIFLLHAFCDQNDEANELIWNTLLCFTPKKWIGFKGIVKSLLWLGIKKYAERNRAMIDELKMEKPNLDFRLVLDVDIGNAAPDLSKSIKDTFEKYAPEIASIIDRFKEKQTDKSEVFAYVRKWLSKEHKRPSVLASENDFIALSELMFWFGNLRIETLLFDDIDTNIDNKFNELDFQTKINIIYGSSFLTNLKLSTIIEKHFESVFFLFTEKYGILFTEETSVAVNAHYILEVDDKDNRFITAEKDNNNAKSVAIIDVLRKMYPKKEYYGTQGHGAKIISNLVGIDSSLNHDDTVKNISKKNLPSHYLVQLNSTFIGYLQYKNRLRTWIDYVGQIIVLRENIVVLFKKMNYGISKYYETKNFSVIINSETYPILIKISNDLQTLPSFPKCAVDCWGFTSEESSNIESQIDKNTYKALDKIISLQKYDKYRKICRDLFTSCSNFIDQAVKLIINRNNNIKAEDQLSFINLINAHSHLIIFQAEFHNNFGIYCKDSLQELEKKEQKIYPQMISLWFFFCNYPDRTIIDAMKYCDNYIYVLLKKEIKSSLFQNLENSIFSYRIIERKWEDKNALWIIGDLQKAASLTCEDFEKLDSHLSGEFFCEALNNSLKKFDLQKLSIVLGYHFNNVCLVFTHKDKLICRSVKKIYTLSLLSSTSSHFFDFQIDDSFPLHELEINGIWENKQKDVAEMFLNNYIQLRVLLNHVVELLTAIDESKSKTDKCKMNDTMLKDYFNVQIKKGEAFFQGIVDVLKEICDLMIKISEDNICKIHFSQIAENYKNYFPDPKQDTDGAFSCAISNDNLADWKKRIDDNSESVMLFCSLMILDSLKVETI